jgi:hypothetical protein
MMVDEKNECSRLIVDPALSCSAGEPLDANYYTNGFKFLLVII